MNLDAPLVLASASPRRRVLLAMLQVPVDVIPADLVMLAIGQGKLGDLVAGLEGVETEWGKIVADARGATGRPGVYTGGDCRNGGKEVVNAAQHGKLAARAITEMLAG